MMPIRLNLLSPQRKTRLLRLIKFLFVKELLEFVVFTSALLAITFLLGWLILTGSLSDLAKSSLLVNRGYPVVNSEVSAINMATKNVVQAGRDFAPVAPFVNEIITTLPPSIKLTSLQIDRDSSTLLLDGIANTRQDLLNYEMTMEKDQNISNVTLPTSQLFQVTDIHFELHATLKGFPTLKPPAS